MATPFPIVIVDRTHEHRQSYGVHHQGAGGNDGPIDGLDEQDRLPAFASGVSCWVDRGGDGRGGGGQMSMLSHGLLGLAHLIADSAERMSIHWIH